MKKQRILIALAILVLATLACQGLSGGGDAPVALPEDASQDGPSSSGGKTSDTGFLMTKDAFNITDIGEESLLYYTKMSQEDVMGFYRNELTSMGYTEREILTSVSEGVFSMVFDGDPSGKALVIQSVDLGDGSRTVAIRLEAV